jgi:hypothetical protein
VTTATEPATGIQQAGVYDIEPERYHADPVAGGSLSSTGAKKILPPSCPALFKHWRDSEERETKAAWNFGKGAHQRLLGVGPKLIEVADEAGKNPAEWRTNECKARVKAIEERGDVPLHPGELAVIEAMVEKLRAHPWAAKLFQPGAGKAEQTIVWQDAQTGVWCRALLDWLPRPGRPGQRFIFRDYKTGITSSVMKPDRTIDDFGYYFQAAFHLAGLRALGIADDEAQALIVMQCKEPPYLVRVVQPDPTAMRIGAIRVREAIDTYAECRAREAAGEPDSVAWPAWSDDVEMVSLPAYTERQYEGI